MTHVSTPLPALANPLDEGSVAHSADHAQGIHKQSAMLSELLLSLYSTTEVSVAATCQFLASLKKVLNLQHATVVIRQPPYTASRISLIYNSHSPDDVQGDALDVDALSAFYCEDPFTNLPLGRYTVIEECMPRRELLESRVYAVHMKPLDIQYLAAVDWRASDDTSLISLRLSRSESQGPFGEDEHALINLLLPHFKQTGLLAQQMWQLRTESQVYANAMPKRSLGMITLDRNGQILQSNSTGMDMLRLGDGLQECDNRISINCPKLNHTFNHTLKLTLASLHSNEQTLSNALAVPRDSGKADYQVLIKPLPLEAEGEQDFKPYLVVLIKDPEQDIEISIRSLMNLYQLTVSEATVAILMAGGRTTDEVAKELNVKRNTIRTHLRAMFMKMGVRQQSKMVSLVLSSLASIQ